MIDYTKENFVERVKSLYPDGLDVVYDWVGGKTLQSSYEITKTEGTLVSIAGVIDQALADHRKIHGKFVFVSPNGEELQEIARLFDNNQLIPPNVEELPLDEVKKALYKSREGHTQGKMVLKIK